MIKYISAILISTIIAPSVINAAEIAPLSVVTSKVPNGIDIMGVRTGMSIDEASQILEGKGYKKINSSGQGNYISCDLGDCISFEGKQKYQRVYKYVSVDANDEVRVTVLPPFAGTKVSSVERRVSYKGATLPAFETVFQSVRPKFGRAVTFDNDRVACWDFRDGALMNPPPTVKSQACGGYGTFRKGISADGYASIWFDTRLDEVVYTLTDKAVDVQIEQHLKVSNEKIFQEKRNNEQKRVNSVPAPRL